MLNFLAQNPWRTPEWRWLRACNITEGGPQTTPRRDGAGIGGTHWAR